MAKKYYAVVNKDTRFSKITRSHIEFDSLVRCSGSIGKGFKKRSKAIDFINQKLEITPHIGSLEKENNLHKLKLNNDELVIYTDASFIDNKSPYSIANIYLSKTDGYKEFYKKIKEPIKGSTDAENMAIIHALEYAKEKSFKNVIIYTDCLNSINEILCQKDFYKDYEKYKDELNISIYHIKAHDNNFYNERCDFLARKALKEIDEEIDDNIIISKEIFENLSNILKDNIDLFEEIIIEDRVSIDKRTLLNKIKTLYILEKEIKNI